MIYRVSVNDIQSLSVESSNETQALRQGDMTALLEYIDQYN